MVHLPLCPVSELRRRGAPLGNGCSRIGCPCMGAKIIDRQATPSYRLTRKIRQARQPEPCTSIGYGRLPCLADFSRRTHPLRQIPRSQRLILPPNSVFPIDKPSDTENTNPLPLTERQRETTMSPEPRRPQFAIAGRRTSRKYDKTS